MQDSPQNNLLRSGLAPLVTGRAIVTQNRVRLAAGRVGAAYSHGIQLEPVRAAVDRARHGSQRNGSISRRCT